ncbi:unnamed protein product [Bursaphelenchus xylophilus]|uniref:(pine wood nematode) hypothetical protein n=1 Tax=Bursaphelenchus xylophilus TaxID=6326 RepID=A0A1I7SC39_BURXY|nr:unnamed protein product [Bursaphelenchus xylophilus]CAG9086489.1 unnamed protein product [Bursaphelenchus xylophilus]
MKFLIVFLSFLAYHVTHACLGGLGSPVGGGCCSAPSGGGCGAQPPCGGGGSYGYSAPIAAPALPPPPPPPPQPIPVPVGPSYVQGPQEAGYVSYNRGRRSLFRRRRSLA